jgi:hypothetical protein
VGRTRAGRAPCRWHHVAEVAGVDVGEQVAAAKRRVGEEGREHLDVLMRLEPQSGRGFEHVEGAQDVRCIGRCVRPEQNPRYRGKVHHGVIAGLVGKVQLVEGRQPRQRRVGLAGIGEVHPKVGDRWVLQRDEIGVGDVVTLLGEVRRDVPAGLAAAPMKKMRMTLRTRGGPGPVRQQALRRQGATGGPDRRRDCRGRAAPFTGFCRSSPPRP